MLSLPYAMLMSGLPSDKTCLYTGIFNCFIVIPEIVAALGLGWFMGAFLAGEFAYQSSSSVASLWPSAQFYRCESINQPALSTKLSVSKD